MRLLDKLLGFRSRYSALRANTLTISSRQFRAALSQGEAQEMVEEFRSVFDLGDAFDDLEQHLLQASRSHMSGPPDMRLFENFVQHARKETPRGTVIKIAMQNRYVVIQYPEKSGVSQTRYGVSFDSIEDLGIVPTLNWLKSITGAYLGDTAKKAKPAKCLGQNTVLTPVRRLRLGRAKDEAR